MDSKLILEAARGTLDGTLLFPDVVGKQFRPGLGKRDVAQLVQNQNVQPFQLFVQPLQGSRLPLADD
jgi:hypothetical protein